MGWEKSAGLEGIKREGGDRTAGERNWFRDAEECEDGCWLESVRNCFHHTFCERGLMRAFTHGAFNYPTDKSVVPGANNSNGFDPFLVYRYLVWQLVMTCGRGGGGSEMLSQDHAHSWVCLIAGTLTIVQTKRGDTHKVSSTFAYRS